MLKRIWYCYLRYHLVVVLGFYVPPTAKVIRRRVYHLVTAYYVTIVRLTAWSICGVIMHFTQIKDVPHKVEYLFGKNGHNWRVFCSGSITIWLIMALQ